MNKHCGPDSAGYVGDLASLGMPARRHEAYSKPLVKMIKQVCDLRRRTEVSAARMNEWIAAEALAVLAAAGRLWQPR
jgi:hypothetical protein